MGRARNAGITRLPTHAYSRRSHQPESMGQLHGVETHHGVAAVSHAAFNLDGMSTETGWSAWESRWAPHDLNRDSEDKIYLVSTRPR